MNRMESTSAASKTTSYNSLQRRRVAFMPRAIFASASVSFDGLRNGLVIDELAFASAHDEFGLAENLQMVRDRRVLNFLMSAMRTLETSAQRRS